MVVLGRGAFSYERGTPVPEEDSSDEDSWVWALPLHDLGRRFAVADEGQEHSTLNPQP